MDPKLQKLLTAEKIFALTRDCINDALNWPSAGDSEIMTMRLSVGEMKKLHGFYGSFFIMKHLTGAGIGRLVRHYFELTQRDITSVPDILLETEESENEACKMLMKHYEDKFGPVSAERVEELNALAMKWDAQDNADLANLMEGKEFGPDTRKGTAPTGMNQEVACAFVSILRTPLDERAEGAKEAVLYACTVLGRAPYTAEFEYATRILGITPPVIDDKEPSSNAMNEGVVRAFKTLLQVPLDLSELAKATSDEEAFGAAKRLMFANCTIIAASVYKAELQESLRRMAEEIQKIAESLLRRS